MRRLAPALVALIAALSAFAGPALYQPGTGEQPEPVGPWSAWGLMSMIFYVPFLLVVVGGAAAAFRAMWIATQRARLASELALGATRQRLVRAHTAAGAREGALAVALGIALGALARQAAEGVGAGHWQSSAAWLWLTVAVLGIVALTLAYRVVALWATRGSVRQVAAGLAAGANGSPADAPARRRPRRRTLVWLGIGAVVVLACGVFAGTGMLSTDGDVSPARAVGVIMVGTVLAATLYLVVPLGLAYAGAKAVTWASRRVMRALAVPSAPGSARSLAADALERPAPLRTMAAVAVVAVMGTATAVTVLYTGINARQQVAFALEPTAVVSTVPVLGTDGSLNALESGWVPGLDPNTLEALRSDESFRAIEAGLLVTDVRAIDVEDVPDDDWANPRRDLLLAVSPESVEDVEPDATRALQLRPGNEWTSGTLGWTSGFPQGTTYVEVDGLRRDTSSIHGSSLPWSGIDRAWAQSVWGEAPTAAILLYSAAGVDVEAALARHDLGDAQVTISAGFGWSSGVNGGLIAAVTAPFLLVAVGIVIALAWSSQRLRAADQATLLALGAQPATLRRAAALEAAIPTALATGVGLAGGLAAGLLLDVTNRDALFSAGMVDGALFTVAAMPWGVLLALAASASALCAAGAVVVRARLDRRSPAAQLTEAQKVGVS
ncbi:FtsX-like permease family protein [Demequina sp.]|uniref:FtsX-like permease family protein n=1 Tax=Demequina sp. TaxID=2050685 RepID=UPI003A88454D